MAQTKVTSPGIADDAVTVGKIPNTSITNAKLANSSITINSSPVSLGGSVTVGETKPTISSISPSVIENTATAVTITGTNFISVPQVEAINSSGAITAADSITYTSATTIVATFTLAVDGNYKLRLTSASFLCKIRVRLDIDFGIHASVKGLSLGTVGRLTRVANDRPSS